MRADKRAVDAWLKGSCNSSSALGCSIRASMVKPVRVLNEGRAIARQQAHASHEVWQYKGLMFCMRCGAVGSRKAQLLVAECRGWTSKHGRGVLEDIGADLVPRGFRIWPAEAEDEEVECGAKRRGGRGLSL